MAMGLSPFPYKLAAFAISAAVSGLAGALHVNLFRFASPDMLAWTMSGELMVMVILGGTGTLTGPLLGAMALVVLETTMAGLTENWQLGLGLILLAVVLYTKGGLVGLFTYLRGRFA